MTATNVVTTTDLDRALSSVWFRGLDNGFVNLLPDWGHVRLVRNDTSDSAILSITMPGHREVRFQIPADWLTTTSTAKARSARKYELTPEAVSTITDKLLPYLARMRAQIMPCGALHAAKILRVRFNREFPCAGYAFLLEGERHWISAALLTEREDVADLIRKCEAEGRDKYQSSPDLVCTRLDGVAVGECGDDVSH